MSNSSSNESSNEAAPAALVIDLLGTGLPAVVWSDDDAVAAHPAFHALNSKKHIQLPAKRDALVAFLTVDPSKIFQKSMLDAGSLVIKAFEHLKMSGKRDGMRNRNWSQLYCAEMLTRLYILLLDNDTLEADLQKRSSGRTRPVIHAAVATLKKMVKKAISESEVRAGVDSKKNKGGRGLRVA
jgi:hypothetical protein